MKNAMKKLMAFALVAIMLVSALPFQASAATGNPITFKVIYDQSDSATSDPIVRVPGNKESATIKAILENWGKIDSSLFMSASINDGTGWKKAAEGVDTVVNAGSSVSVRVDMAKPENGIEIKNPEDDPNYTPDEDTDGNEGNEDAGNAGSGNTGSNKEEDTYNPITFKVLLNDDDNVYFHKVAETQRDSAPIADLLTYWFDADWTNDYTFKHAYVTDAGATKGTTVTDVNTTIYLGQSVSVRLTEKNNTGNNSGSNNNSNNNSTTTTTTDPIKLIIKVDDETQRQVKFEGKESATVNALLANYWKSTWDFDYYLVNDSEVEKTDLTKTVYAGDTVTVYMETHVSKLNSNKVYLHVFMNNDFDDAVKNINITDGIAADGVVDVNNDVKTVIKQYFTAKDSDGIKYDGLYVSTGNWVGDFLTDTKDEYVDNIKELKEDGYVHLNLMITNAKLKTTSTADSTNPKTGDSIFMTVTVMTLSASALALFFFLNKKRAVK